MLAKLGIIIFPQFLRTNKKNNTKQVIGKNHPDGNKGFVAPHRIQKSVDFFKINKRKKQVIQWLKLKPFSELFFSLPRIEIFQP